MEHLAAVGGGALQFRDGTSAQLWRRCAISCARTQTRTIRWHMPLPPALDSFYS